MSDKPKTSVPNRSAKTAMEEAADLAEANMGPFRAGLARRVAKRKAAQGEQAGEVQSC